MAKAQKHNYRKKKMLFVCMHASRAFSRLKNNFLGLVLSFALMVKAIIIIGVYSSLSEDRAMQMNAYDS